jgi:predicted dinucleotide-binding enzyme
MMKIGSLGAGEVAQAFAIHLLKAGRVVLLSNSRGPSSLTQLVSKQTRTQGTWLDLELSLWTALADKVKTWGQENYLGVADR